MLWRNWRREGEWKKVREARMADCTAVAKRDRGSVGGRQKAEVKGVGCDEVGCGGGKDGSHEKDKQGKREG